MMNANNKKSEDTLIMKFLDNELSPEEERKALHMIAENEDMRAMLRFDRTLSNSLAGKQHINMSTVPEGFTDQVMDQINKMESVRSENRNKISIPDLLKQWIDSLLMPRQVQYRPGIAYLFILILALGFGYYTEFNSGFSSEMLNSGNGDIQLASEREAEERVWIRFIYIDEEASEIAVAGDFSDWEPIPLEKQIVEGKQLWSGLIPITKGEHKYMFVKDGEEWLTDPLAEVKRDDGFGNKNAVIIL